MKLIWGLTNIILLFSTYIAFTDHSAKEELQSAREVTYALVQDQLEFLILESYRTKNAKTRADLIKTIKTALKKWEDSYELDYLINELNKYINPCYDTYDYTALKYQRKEISNQFLKIERSDNEFDKLNKIVPFVRRLLLWSCNLGGPPAIQLIHGDTLTLKSNQTYSFEYRIMSDKYRIASNQYSDRLYINQESSETVKIKLGNTQTRLSLIALRSSEQMN